MRQGRQPTQSWYQRTSFALTHVCDKFSFIELYASSEQARNFADVRSQPCTNLQGELQIGLIRSVECFCNIMTSGQGNFQKIAFGGNFGGSLGNLDVFLGEKRHSLAIFLGISVNYLKYAGNTVKLIASLASVLKVWRQTNAFLVSNLRINCRGPWPWTY